MGKAELMQEKIEFQRQLPNEIKEKLNNITFVNFLVSIAIMIYLIVVNLLFMNETVEIFTNCTKASVCTFAIFDIFLFELSYRKDSGTLAIYAIELLCVCLFVLCIPYIFIYINPIARKIVMFSPVYFSIYYVAKTIIVHIAQTTKYRNHLSDVTEILKDDLENSSYIDEFEEENSGTINVSESEIIDITQEINKKT